jgi:hypothetical protein
MASLIFQAFGVPLTAVEMILGTIENMKFFLRTGFGDSTTFVGGEISINTQGLTQTQGNGASLAVGQSLLSAFWELTGKKDMEQNSTAPTLTCSIISRQSFMWMTLTYCILT